MEDVLPSRSVSVIIKSLLLGLGLAPAAIGESAAAIPPDFSILPADEMG